MKVAILLLAAGRGTRLGAEIPKAYLRLGPAPLLIHSAARLLAAVPETHRCELLVLVQPEDREAHLAPCLERLQKRLPTGAELKVVDGGATRQESMDRGLAARADDSDLARTQRRPPAEQRRDHALTSVYHPTAPPAGYQPYGC